MKTPIEVQLLQFDVPNANGRIYSRQCFAEALSRFHRRWRICPEAVPVTVQAIPPRLDGLTDDERRRILAERLYTVDETRICGRLSQFKETDAGVTAVFQPSGLMHEFGERLGKGTFSIRPRMTFTPNTDNPKPMDIITFDVVPGGES